MRKIVSIVIACAALFLGGWGIWLFVGMFQEASPNVKVSILSLMGVVIVATVGHFLTKKREIDARHFSEKRNIHSKIISVISSAMSSSVFSNAAPLPETELARKLLDCKKELVIWGSADVIQAWNQFEMDGLKGDAKGTLRAMERVLRAIRKDLGQDDGNLKLGELFGLFIKAEEKETFLNRHSRESGNPGGAGIGRWPLHPWIPAFAGMTIRKILDEFISLLGLTYSDIPALPSPIPLTSQGSPCFQLLQH